MREYSFAHQLLSSANKDLTAIKNMTDPGAFAEEVFGFHAQQAIEKSLKAWIALLGGAYPFVHDLGALLNTLDMLGADVDPLWDLIELNAFAVQFRYEAFESLDDPLDRPALTAQAEMLLHKVATLLKDVVGTP
jgi:HEPN domain-containing protein